MLKGLMAYPASIFLCSCPLWNLLTMCVHSPIFNSTQCHIALWWNRIDHLVPYLLPHQLNVQGSFTALLGSFLARQNEDKYLVLLPYQEESARLALAKIQGFSEQCVHLAGVGKMREHSCLTFLCGHMCQRLWRRIYQIFLTEQEKDKIYNCY